MSILLPIGMIDFRAALALVAEAHFPNEWSKARPVETELLTDSESSLRGLAARFACQPGSVPSLAYAKLRPQLADGTLPASLRMVTGGAKAILPASWTAESADQLGDVVTGNASFSLLDGTISTGIVLVHNADLKALLNGMPVSNRIAEPVEVHTEHRATPASQSRRAGRRPKAGHDAFWVEVVRLAHVEGAPAKDVDWTNRMAQWCQDNMADPYDEETIRKKLRAALTVLRAN